jgi:hypothetical protein
MASFLGHLLLLVLAGLALFRLWRSTRSTDRWLNAAIAAGFALRALLGAALFWISYLHLPIATSLQKGDGLWFFAVDAFQYYPQALGAANAGVWTIITFDRTVAAVAFVQAFATAVLLFGRVASAALLLNAFCYLGAMWVIVRSSAQDERARIAARIAVIAISLSPTFILWSLQPLKDTMFQFLVVAFVGACVAWQRVWTSSAHAGRATALAAAMSAAMFLLSGLRWYFALVVLLGAAAFAILVAFRATQRKAVSFAAAVLVLFVLSRAFLFGAGPYVPPAIHDVLTPSTNGHVLAGAAFAMTGGVENARQGFERSGGATQIGLGGNLAKLDAKTAPSKSDDPPHPEAEKKQDDSDSRDEVASADTPSNTTPPPATAVTQSAPPTESAAAPMASAATTPVDVPPVTATTSAPPPALNQASAPAAVSSAAPAPVATVSEAPKTQPAKTEVAKATPRPVHHLAARKTKRKPAAVVQAPPVAVVATPAPVVVHRAAPVRPPEPPLVVPASRVARLAAGTAAVIVPRGIGQRAGLFEIGGGKGLWWFSDLDTIVFDLVALFAVYLTFRWLRAASLRNPVFWLVAAVTVLIGVPLVYTVTNFGTLLRLREMIYLGLLLIPLALATPQPPLAPARVVETEPQAGSGSASLFSRSNASSRSL